MLDAGLVNRLDIPLADLARAGIDLSGMPVVWAHPDDCHCGFKTLRGSAGRIMCGDASAPVTVAVAGETRTVSSVCLRPRVSRHAEPLPAGPPPARTRGGSRNSATDLPEGRLGELLYRRWLDDPQLELSGLSPRQAASHPEHRATLERLLRSIEHGSARERRDGKPGPEVSWVRGELGLDTPLAA